MAPRPSRTAARAVLAACAAACGDRDAGPSVPIEAGSTGIEPTGVEHTGADDTGDTPARPDCGAVSFAWDPAETVALAAFPDDAHTVDDPAVASGVRVQLAGAGWFEALPAFARSLMVHADGAPGFARQGPAILVFSGDVGAPPADGDLRLVELDSGAEVPIATRLADGGALLVATPLRPLRAAVPHALVLSTDHLAADGACVAASEALADALAGRRADRLGDRLAQVPAAVGWPAERIAAATVFTPADGGADLAAAADDVAAQPWSLSPWSCAPVGDVLRCDATLAGADYRVPRPEGPGAVGPRRVADWDLAVTLRAPLGVADAPLVIYGHGMEGSRHELDLVAQQVTDLGVAVVAMDALHHGDHPTRRASLAALPFLGIDLVGLTLDAPQARGSFDQTALERLQLLAALAADPAVPGGPRLDLERVGYHGSSLGGLIGPAVVAHAPSIDAAFLTVAGGDLVRLAADIRVGQGTVGDLLQIALGGDVRTWELFLAVEPVALDGSDPAVHAAHPRVAGVHAALVVGQDDELVTRAAGHALARGLGLPQLTPVLEPVPPLSVVTAPASANQAGVTRAFAQHGAVTFGGQVVPSTHVETLLSAEVAAQVRAFWAGWAAGDAPALIAP